jgi:nicotinate-nucleotide adenylyltransferase
MRKKIGLFGGSFNPPHNGHVEVARSVLKKVGLDEILVVPTGTNPLKPMVEGPSAEARLKMTEIAFEGEKVRIDRREINNQGPSYTIETLRALKSENPNADFSIILGIDHVAELLKWRQWDQLLAEADFIFVTRPGHDLPSSKADLPEFLQPFVRDVEFNFFQLSTGRSLQFVRIPEIPVSSTELRKQLRSGKASSPHIPLGVEGYIRELGLYKRVGDKIKDYEQFAVFCAQQLNEKKAIAVRVYDLRGNDAPAEFVVVASGTSTRHASSMAEGMMRKGKEEFSTYPQGAEGIGEGRWVVLDYGSCMVHIFYDFVRQDYRIEDLWRKAPEVKWDSQVGQC